MQSRNPLFPQADDASEESGVLYLHPKAKPASAPTPTAAVSAPVAAALAKPDPEPVQTATEKPGENAALTLIRDKLARIYAEEPDAAEEQQKAAAAKPRSKHQEFMSQLHHSGKSLAEVQTAWHKYYTELPDHEKHQVWQEFYEANEAAKAKQHIATEPQPYQPLRLPPASLSQAFTHPQPTVPILPKPLPSLAQVFNLPIARRPIFAPATPRKLPVDKRTPAEIRSSILSAITANGRIGLKHHLQSLSFGLAIGFVTLVIALFGLFNEVIIAPFIQPGRTVGATPIIVDPSSIAATTEPEIIIPKINLEIPVDYSQTANDEETIQGALEKGIVHYPSTVTPGQSGNAAFFGHSSNNLFSPGKYKFAFVLLHELQPGDTFYLTKDGKAYVYKVFATKVVNPDQVEILDDVPGHIATATLITCDPPGTALRRLAVIGDQISPDPASNGAGTNTAQAAAVGTQLPDNGPSLLQRIWNSIF